MKADSLGMKAAEPATVRPIYEVCAVDDRVYVRSRFGHEWMCEVTGNIGVDRVARAEYIAECLNIRNALQGRPDLRRQLGITP